MRILAGIALLCSMVPAMAGAQVLFNQDFSSSPNVQDYNATNHANTVTGDNRFNFVDVPTIAIVSTVGGNLQLSNTGVMDTIFGKTFSATPVPLLSMQFDVNLAFTGQIVGEGIGFFQFGNPAGSPTANWGGVAFEVGSGGNAWRILNGNGSSFTGTQTVTMFLNGSGSAVTYIDPNGAEQNLADHYTDVWVGNTLAGSVYYSWENKGGDLTGFRWLSPNAWLPHAVTATFDNFRIRSSLNPEAKIGLFFVTPSKK